MLIFSCLDIKSIFQANPTIKFPAFNPNKNNMSVTKKSLFQENQQKTIRVEKAAAAIFRHLSHKSNLEQQ